MIKEDPAVSLIACSRAGHRVVRNWMMRKVGYMPGRIEQKPFDESIEEAKPGLGILLIRDFPNWLASVISWRGFPDRSDFMIEFINGYIDTYVTHLENAFTIPTIVFPEWVKVGHGVGINHVTTRFKDRDILNRYKLLADNEIYQEISKVRLDAVSLSKRVFNPSVVEGVVPDVTAVKENVA